MYRKTQLKKVKNKKDLEFFNDARKLLGFKYVVVFKATLKTLSIFSFPFLP